MKATLSQQHEDFTLEVSSEPLMGDELDVPLFGVGIVTGLNPSYQGTGQPYVMVKFTYPSTSKGLGPEEREARFPYAVAEKQPDSTP